MVEADWKQVDLSGRDFCGALVQYPDTDGHISDFSQFVVKAHENGVSSRSILAGCGRYHIICPVFCKKQLMLNLIISIQVMNYEDIYY